MLSIAAGGSAFKPYYRPDSLPPAAQEPLKKIYSDFDASFSSLSKEKGRRKRTTFSQHQATVLEQEFLSDRYMARDKRLALADVLRLTEHQVKTWFQNRRAKDKRDKKTESPPCSTSPDSSVLPHPCTYTLPDDKALLSTPHISQPTIVEPVASPSLSEVDVQKTNTPSPKAIEQSTPNISSRSDLFLIPGLNQQSTSYGDYNQHLSTFGLNPLAPISSVSPSAVYDPYQSSTASFRLPISASLPPLSCPSFATPLTAHNSPTILSLNVTNDVYPLAVIPDKQLTVL